MNLDDATLRVSKKLRLELDRVGNRHEETYNDIITKCIRAYKRNKK